MNQIMKPGLMILGVLMLLLLALALTQLASHAFDNALPAPTRDARLLTPTLKDMGSGQAGIGGTGALPATSLPATLPNPSATVLVTPTIIFTRGPSPTLTLVSTPLPTATITLTAIPMRSPETWKQWPVMPTVSAEMRQLYQQALASGSIDINAFSVFGDCQSEAEAFLGVFDTSPGLVETMATELEEIVAQFQGSFSRYNPAAKSGSSAGSLLYAPWNDNKEGKCNSGETPVDCELRVHRPSIVLIHTGTHFEPEKRNYDYLSTIIQKVLATGAVPVIVTKADNLELDEHVNRNLALLAAQYRLPMWNFWASVNYLPDEGLMPDKMHLTQTASTVHQLDALRTLGLVWRALR